MGIFISIQTLKHNLDQWLNEKVRKSRYQNNFNQAKTESTSSDKN